MPLRRFLPLLLASFSACSPGAPAPASPPPRAEAATDWTIPATAPAAPIPRQEFAARRAALAARMENGVLVVFGAPEPEADYLPFAQNTAFRYLTGITEPGAALVLSKQGGTVRERLFVPARNPGREVWEGARLGTEGAQALTGIPAQTVDRLLPALDSLLPTAGTLYTTAVVADGPDPLATRTPEQQIVMRLAERHPGTRIVPIGEALDRIRATKSPTELDRIRRAVYITVLAQREAMRSIQPGMNEFEVQALIEYLFRRHGAERPSFASIVGSGPNSVTLHYNADDRFMAAEEVVVMDIGASYGGYAADVTRTVPVSGTFSPEQRAIYEIVLRAQKAAEAVARPGASWQELNAAASRTLAEGLAELGLIEAPDATYACAAPGSRCPQLGLFFIHGLGHGIGLEVHDPDLSYYEPFAVGSAFTIEPGIYVRADALDSLPDTPENRALIQRLRPVVERYRDIGVRIEDDYFITPSGVERISEGAPREIAEIEALMAEEGIGERSRRPEVVEWYRGIQGR